MFLLALYEMNNHSLLAVAKYTLMDIMHGK
jgi:hypothetical protein